MDIRLYKKMDACRSKEELLRLLERRRKDAILSQRQREEEMIYAKPDYNLPFGLKHYVVKQKSRLRRAMPSLRVGCGFMVLWGMLARRMSRE